MNNNTRMCCIGVLLLVIGMTGQLHADAFDACLLKALGEAEDGQTVGELKQQCEQKVTAAKAVSDEESALEIRMKDEDATWDNPFVITPHKPNYVLLAAYNSTPNGEPFDATDDQLDNTEIKFQISFKFPVMQDLFGDNGDLYFAYTNQSYWQAYNSDISSPFRETNHEPEVFMLFDTDWHLGSLKSSKLALGAIHQSNGLAGEQSRSWNRLFANFIIEASDNLYFSVRPWWRIPESAKTDDNPDINDYLGYGEFRTFYKTGNHNLSMMLRNNLKTSGNKGGIQLDWSFPLYQRLRGYVQYYNGYGESLIDYNASVNRLGFGFMLTDWL